MGTLLLNSDHEIRSALREEKFGVVTLLFPKKTLNRFDEKMRRNLPKKLPDLLKRYAKYIASTKRLSSKAGKILYQSNFGQERLQRINARVGSGSWALLGILAQAHGVSRCYLFNYLLWLDEVGVGDSVVQTMNEGAPTFHSYYRYIQLLDLRNHEVVRRLEFDPNPFSVLDYRDWFDF
ncbi:DUF1564 domain-containing protein [Leptospira sp. WS92.C1]